MKDNSSMTEKMTLQEVRYRELLEYIYMKLHLFREAMGVESQEDDSEQLKNL